MGKRNRHRERQQARTHDGHDASDVALLAALEQALGEAWQRGWQPTDAVRFVRRVLSAGHTRVLIDSIAAQHRQYAAVTIDARWADQLAAMGAHIWWKPSASYIWQRADRDGATPEAVLSLARGVLALLRLVPCLPRLIPLPGEATPRARRTGGVDGKLLERVRALLAKAESTTFAEEADALTAKAQELMARHAIDQAMLDATRGEQADVGGRRIAVDDPYAGAKGLLLSRVADANRCRCVCLGDLGCSDVFGSQRDLDTVELLFTSLLRQATTSMLAHGPRPRAGSTRSFRRSFLVAFAVRIGTRLREQDAATVEAAAGAHGAGVLPVLASHAAAAEEALEAAYPRTRPLGPRANDPAGWAAGTAAADVANLGLRAEVSESATA